MLLSTANLSIFPERRRRGAQGSRAAAAHKVHAIETVLFDFGGTLDADGVAWKERFYALYRDEGLNVSAEAFAPVFYAADDALVGALAPTTGLAETVETLVEGLEVELARRA